MLSEEASKTWIIIVLTVAALISIYYGVMGNDRISNRAFAFIVGVGAGYMVLRQLGWW